MYDKILGQIVSQWLKNNPSFSIDSIEHENLNSFSSKQFEDAVIEGKWDEMIQELEEKVKTISKDDEESIFRLKRTVFELTAQKVQEKIAEGDQIEALRILRNELSPMGIDTFRIHQLTQSLLSTKTNQPVDREVFAQTIMRYLKGLLYSDSRLEELIEQAKEYQKMTCPFHRNEPQEKEAVEGLWLDHKCKVQGPRVSGGSKTNLLGLLDLDGVRVLKLSISQDKSILIMVAKHADSVKLFQTDLKNFYATKMFKEGFWENFEHSIWPRTDFRGLYLAHESLMEKFENDLSGKMVALAQMPDENLIIHSTEGQITTLFDKKNLQVLHSWIRLRCSYLLTPADVADRYFLAVADDGRILQISTESYEILKTLPSVDEKHAVSSAFLDGKRLLIGFANSTLYYYEDWQSYEHPTRIFRGHTCVNHRTSAILSSSNANLALACSENGSVYGWNLQTGRLIYEIKMHEGCVTDIFETCQEEFITSGEDGKVYLWRIQ